MLLRKGFCLLVGEELSRGKCAEESEVCWGVEMGTGDARY